MSISGVLKTISRLHGASITFMPQLGATGGAVWRYAFHLGISLGRLSRAVVLGAGLHWPTDNLLAPGRAGHLTLRLSYWPYGGFHCSDFDGHCQHHRRDEQLLHRVHNPNVRGGVFFPLDHVPHTVKMLPGHCDPRRGPDEGTGIGRLHVIN